ncbi:hypothetical protein R3I93_011255 [Phoxinus phoxinus]|uniref:Uncharacterized protein n=1 Tax=Phoxinus phoxinus TaxID=58324 RepID=A0AAN9H5Z2_9TELE
MCCFCSRRSKLDQEVVRFSENCSTLATLSQMTGQLLEKTLRKSYHGWTTMTLSSCMTDLLCLLNHYIIQSLTKQAVFMW